MWIIRGLEVGSCRCGSVHLIMSFGVFCLLQMSELRTNCQYLYAKFTQLRSVPSEVKSLFSTVLELYVSMQFACKCLVVLSLLRKGT